MVLKLLGLSFEKAFLIFLLSVNFLPRAEGQCRNAFEGSNKIWKDTHLVLDTNILMNSPLVILQFPEAHIVVPYEVIRELDYLKGGHNSPRFSLAPKMARAAVRVLGEYWNKKDGNHETIKLDNGSTLKILPHRTPDGLQDMNLNPKLADDRILAEALQLKNSAERVVLVTQDLSLKLKADSYHIEVMHKSHIEKALGSINTMSYLGYADFEVSPDIYQELKESRQIDPSKLTSRPFLPNEFAVVSTPNQEDPIVARYYSNRQTLKVIPNLPNRFPLEPRNLEQEMALHLLLSPSVNFVTLQGEAGTGKTLLALAAGLFQTSPVLTDKPYFREVYLARSNVNVDDEQTGFLPGDEKQKNEPQRRAFLDNIEFLAETILGGVQPQRNSENVRKNARRRRGQINKERHENDAALPADSDNGDMIALPSDMKSIENLVKELELSTTILTLAYMRGRSLPQIFLIIDEAQNLSYEQIQTLVTRIGERAKLVLMGDISQVDRHHLRASTNAFYTVSHAFRSHPTSGHITLKEVERSPFVRDALEIFKRLRD